MNGDSLGARHLATVLGLYMVTVSIAACYYNWEFAKQNGFVRWLLLGEIVPTAKGLVWPYFALTQHTSPVRDSATPVKPLTQAQIASMELKKMVDALNASQQATYLINEGSGERSLGIRSYNNIDKIVSFRRIALDIGRKANCDVLNSIYPELGSHFSGEFLVFLETFVSAYETNSDDVLRQADIHNDRWAAWYQANQHRIQVASDRALGY